MDTRQNRPASMSTETIDIVIIGGGIIGSSIAYHIAQHDQFDGSIAVVERDQKYKECSTVFATGVIRSQFSTPENIQMSLYSSAFLKNVTHYLSVDGDNVDIGFHEHGYLLLATTDEVDTFHQSHSAQLDYNAAVEFLDAAEISSRFPLIQNPAIVGGFLSTANDGSFDPYSLLQAFRKKARSLGVKYIEDEVVGLKQVGHSVDNVELRSGTTISAGAVVNAAGARDAAKVCGMVGIELPVEPRKRTTYYVGAESDLTGFPMTVLPSGIWIRPEGDGFLCGHTPDAEHDVPTENFEPDHDDFEEIIWPTIWETIPAFEALRVISAYAGHYDFNTLDENAIIGRLPGASNFYVATGFSGHGLMHAPATGEAVAELIVEGEYKRLDITRLGYQRILDDEPIKELNVF